ncbi:hypothetical protein BC827DRAFT_341954 [Russula dissimulans]|nr:hypothetical protein BC827DRAFT_341954 [Russula dissimulans]
MREITNQLSKVTRSNPRAHVGGTCPLLWPRLANPIGRPTLSPRRDVPTPGIEEVSLSFLYVANFFFPDRRSSFPVLVPFSWTSSSLYENRDTNGYNCYTNPSASVSSLDAHLLYSRLRLRDATSTTPTRSSKGLASASRPHLWLRADTLGHPC